MDNNSLTLPLAYAVWHPNEDIRRGSSSGGAFSLLAEQTLQRGGVVFGAAWDDQLGVKIVATENVKDVLRLRGSKYVFSDATESYQQVLRFLRQGRVILYSGAPCQIAALRRLTRGIDVRNLLTVDFICHGMPEKKIFDKYIRHLESKYDDKIIAVDFRDKRFGVEANLLLRVVFKNLGEKIIYGKRNTYYWGFVHNVIMRKCCLGCIFNQFPRQADLSLCDYRGLGEHVPFTWEADKVKGFTGVLVNSGKGYSFLNGIPQGTIIKRPLEELVAYQPLLCPSAKRSEIRRDFEIDFEKMDWSELERKYLVTSRGYRLYIFMRRFLGPSLFLRLGIIYKRLKGVRTSSWFLPSRIKN